MRDAIVKVHAGRIYGVDRLACIMIITTNLHDFSLGTMPCKARILFMIITHRTPSQ